MQTLFTFTGHMAYNEESPDMAWYVWTEEETEIHLSIIEDFFFLK